MFDVRCSMLSAGVKRCEMGQRSRLPWIGMIDPQITKSIFADSEFMNQSASIYEICG